MEQRFIKKENNPRLLLFFAGWGSDEHLFSRPVEDGYDYLLCFDYRTLDFDYSLLDGYREIRLLAWSREIRLLAWSMGVWVAGQVLTGKDYPWQMRLAVGGTPFPIDDRKGIPEAIFRATLENGGAGERISVARALPSGTGTARRAAGVRAVRAPSVRSFRMGQGNRRDGR